MIIYYISPIGGDSPHSNTFHNDVIIMHFMSHIPTWQFKGLTYKLKPNNEYIALSTVYMIMITIHDHDDIGIKLWTSLVLK